MTVLVTGAAGFIGYHVSEFLLGRGETVVGLDAVTDYYDPGLKEARTGRLRRHGGFTPLRLNLADRDAVFAALTGIRGIDRVVHLAAQAGVRYSHDRPFAYVDANLAGHMTVLEYCRHLSGLKHLVYASSSSVYGANAKLPFAVGDRTDTPLSLYAATKRANEHMSYCYGHLYGIPQTGLRFFTVYGPWGRPDMALYKFTAAILEGRPIDVFNDGDMKRDFTFIDDVVPAVAAALDNPPYAASGVPHRLYNIGNNRPEPLMRLIAILEDSLGTRAKIDFRPMQPGDVKETCADISESRRDLGFAPVTPIDIGVPRFVDWFRGYHKV